jgi:hypothetical protein
MSAIAFAVVLFIAGMGLGAACSPRGPQLPAYCTDEVAFTAVLVRCVDASATREESRKCRAAAHEKCGIVMTTSARSVAP